MGRSTISKVMFLSLLPVIHNLGNKRLQNSQTVVMWAICSYRINSNVQTVDTHTTNTHTICLINEYSRTYFGQVQVLKGKPTQSWVLSIFTKQHLTFLMFHLSTVYLVVMSMRSVSLPTIYITPQYFKDSLERPRFPQSPYPDICLCIKDNLHLSPADNVFLYL